jgi:hypothetical protein
MIPKTRLAHTDAMRIRCDHCRLYSYVFGMTDRTPQEIRRIAARSGWKHEGEQDLCPSCDLSLAGTG